MEPNSRASQLSPGARRRREFIRFVDELAQARMSGSMTQEEMDRRFREWFGGQPVGAVHSAVDGKTAAAGGGDHDGDMV